MFVGASLQEPHRRAYHHLRPRGRLLCAVRFRQHVRGFKPAASMASSRTLTAGRSFGKERRCGVIPDSGSSAAPVAFEVNDVLLELLEDESLQSAIQQQAFPGFPEHRVFLGAIEDFPQPPETGTCPRGCSWMICLRGDGAKPYHTTAPGSRHIFKLIGVGDNREHMSQLACDSGRAAFDFAVCLLSKVHDLPVTYKFNSKKMCQTGNSRMPRQRTRLCGLTMTRAFASWILHSESIVPGSPALPQASRSKLRVPKRLVCCLVNKRGRNNSMH